MKRIVVILIALATLSLRAFAVETLPAHPRLSLCFTNIY